MTRTSRDLDEAAERVEAAVREANGVAKDLRRIIAESNTLLRDLTREVFARKLDEALTPQIQRMAKELDTWQGKRYDEITRTLEDTRHTNKVALESILGQMMQVIEASPGDTEAFVRALGDQLGRAIAITWKKEGPRINGKPPPVPFSATNGLGPLADLHVGLAADEVVSQMPHGTVTRVTRRRGGPG